MSNVVALKNDFDWDNPIQLKEVRQLISQCPLSDTEFSYLVQLGKATKLNPFNREIWAIKYSSKAAAQIFIGRDGYRIAASRHPMYLRHQVVAVYSKDDFKVVNDEIMHSYGLGDRGQLESAYCKVYLRGQIGYSYVYVTMKEYGLTQSVWKDKPETMLKKVSEAQALRQGFPDFFAGTYSDAEFPQEEQSKMRVIQGNTQTQKLKNILGIEENDIKKHDPDVIDNNTSQSENALDVSIEQLERIEELFKIKGFSQERIMKALNHYHVKELTELDCLTADEFISQLERAK